jgi:predicted nucleic acid-binding protein
MESLMDDFLVVDSDILIDVGRNVAAAVERLRTEESKHLLAVSTITVLELLVGCRNKQEQRDIERFLRRFQVLPLDPQISSTATKLLKRYRLSHGLLIPDALIAATAIEAEAPFLSKNLRDYRFIEGLKLEKY